MVAMNEDRMILFLEDDFHDRVHNFFGDVDLLGALHIDDKVTDAILLHESLELWREVFLYERAVSGQDLILAGLTRAHLQNRLKA